MNFYEWLEAYYSGTQIDDVIAHILRGAFLCTKQAANSD